MNAAPARGSAQLTSAFLSAARSTEFLKHFPDQPVIYQPPLPHAANAANHLEAVARAHADAGQPPPRFDRALYSGTHRQYATMPPSEEWIRRQKAAGLQVARTDSGYITADAPISQIVAILDAAQRLGEKHSISVEAVLPIDASWLRTRATELADAIANTSSRVSLMGAHTGDPFGTSAVVKGLVQCVYAGDVRVDRSDLSAIGALVFGAGPGSIGSASGLRHVYPPSKSGGARSPRVSVLVRPLMAWKYPDDIRLASESIERDDLWRCLCDVCRGRRVGDAVWTEEDAFRHSLYAATALADDVFDSSSPLETFRARIHTGQHNSLDVAEALGPRWKPQSFLAAWLSVIPAAVPA